MREDGTVAVRSAGERWSARRSHKVVWVSEAGGGRLVLIGGFSRGSASGSSAEIWAAQDVEGSWRWRLTTSTAAFGPRDGHACATTIDGSLLVLGGASEGERLTTHDVWASTDGGATFELATETPGWCGRTHHEAVAHRGKVVVLGASLSLSRRSSGLPVCRVALVRVRSVRGPRSLCRRSPRVSRVRRGLRGVRVLQRRVAVVEREGVGAADGVGRVKPEGGTRGLPWHFTC